MTLYHFNENNGHNINKGHVYAMLVLLFSLFSFREQ